MLFPLSLAACIHVQPEVMSIETNGTFKASYNCSSCSIMPSGWGWQDLDGQLIDTTDWLVLEATGTRTKLAPPTPGTYRIVLLRDGEVVGRSKPMVVTGPPKHGELSLNTNLTVPGQPVRAHAACPNCGDVQLTIYISESSAGNSSITIPFDAEGAELELPADVPGRYSVAMKSTSDARMRDASLQWIQEEYVVERPPVRCAVELVEAGPFAPRELVTVRGRCEHALGPPTVWMVPSDAPSDLSSFGAYRIMTRDQLDGGQAYMLTPCQPGPHELRIYDADHDEAPAQRVPFIIEGENACLDEEPQGAAPIPMRLLNTPAEGTSLEIIYHYSMIGDSWELRYSFADNAEYVAELVDTKDVQLPRGDDRVLQGWKITDEGLISFSQPKHVGQHSVRIWRLDAAADIPIAQYDEIRRSDAELKTVMLSLAQRIGRIVRGTGEVESIRQLRYAVNGGYPDWWVQATAGAAEQSATATYEDVVIAAYEAQLLRDCEPLVASLRTLQVHIGQRVAAARRADFAVEYERGEAQRRSEKEALALSAEALREGLETAQTIVEDLRACGDHHVPRSQSE